MPQPVQLLTSQFGDQATTADVIDEINLEGKRALVTGASSGIGIETARALASAGADVTLAVRNVDAGESFANDIVASTGNSHVQVSALDLIDLQSVADFTARWDGPLHILVNNAGLIAGERDLTATGWESTMSTNFLGHFALTNWLHDALEAANGARIVSLTSQAHMRSPVVFDDMNFSNRPFDSMLAYGQSKTAAILLAVEANRRWATDSITANAVNPGAIAATGLTRHMAGATRSTVQSVANFTFKSLEQGAATTLFVATSPLLEGIGGRYFEDCKEMPTVEVAEALLSAGDPLTPNAVASYALDPSNARRLWDFALPELQR